MTTEGRVRLKDAAERLGVHRETLRRWAHDGMVTYWAIGRRKDMEFDPKDIEALDRSFKRDRAEPPVHYLAVDLANDKGVSLTMVVPSEQLGVVKDAAAKHGITLKEQHDGEG